MSLRLILSSLLAMAACAVVAADDVKVQAEYIYVISPDETERQAEAKALEQARLKAIAERFGTFVSRSTAVKGANVDGAASMAVSTLGSSDIAGVWLSTIFEDTKHEIVDGRAVIRATVAGRARGIDVTAPEFEVTIGRLSPDGELIPAGDFKHRERFDIGFISPADGYVAIYATDGINNAFRLLPEAGANLAEPMRVLRGQAYRFFQYSNPVMTLDSGEQSAVLRISVIFRPGKKAFALPVDESLVSEHGDITGWLVSQDRYRSWLAKMLSNNKTQRQDIYVTITR